MKILKISKFKYIDREYSQSIKTLFYRTKKDREMERLDNCRQNKSQVTNGQTRSMNDDSGSLRHR